MYRHSLKMDPFWTKFLTVFDQMGVVWVTAYPSAILTTSILSFSNKLSNVACFVRLEKISARVKTEGISIEIV